jgi:hypothetical protein
MSYNTAACFISLFLGHLMNKSDRYLICYAQVQTYDPLQLCVHTALTLAEEI